MAWVPSCVTSSVPPEIGGGGTAAVTVGGNVGRATRLAASTSIGPDAPSPKKPTPPEEASTPPPPKPSFGPPGAGEPVPRSLEVLLHPWATTMAIPIRGTTGRRVRMAPYGRAIGVPSSGRSKGLEVHLEVGQVRGRQLGDVAVLRCRAHAEAIGEGGRAAAVHQRCILAH